MIPVWYMGHHARTGSIVGLTEDGVKFGESARRLPVEDRWTLEGWDKLRGFPWGLKLKDREAIAVFVCSGKQTARRGWWPVATCCVLA